MELTDALYPVAWVEKIQVLLALLSQHSGDMSMLTDVVFHCVPDERLGRKFNRCKLTDPSVHMSLSRIHLVNISTGQSLRDFHGSRRQVSHLLQLDILDELSPGK